MRDTQIKHILEKLGILWTKKPDLSFGRIVSRLRDDAGCDIFFAKDDDIEIGLDDWIEELNDFVKENG